MANSCPVKSSAEYKAVANVFGTQNADSLYHINLKKNPDAISKMPSVIRSYKLMNRMVPLELIKSQRNTGFSSVVKIINAGDNTLFGRERKILLEETLEKYGYENDFTFVKLRGERYSLRNKLNNPVTYRDVIPTLEEVAYKNQSGAFQEEVIEGILGGFEISPHVMASHTLMTNFERYGFQNEDVAELQKVFNGTKVLPLKGGLFLGTFLSRLSNYGRLKERLTVNPLMARGIIGEAEYNAIAALAPVKERELNSLVAEYAIGRLLADTASIQSEQELMAALGKYAMDDTAKTYLKLVLKDLTGQRGIFPKGLKNATVVDSINNSMHNHSDNLKTARKEFDTAKQLAEIMDENSIGSLKNTLNRREEILTKMINIENILLQQERYSTDGDTMRMKTHSSRIKTITGAMLDASGNRKKRIQHLLVVNKVLKNNVVADFESLYHTIVSTDFASTDFKQASAILLKSRRIVDAYMDVVDMLKQELDYINQKLVEQKEPDKLLIELSDVVNELSRMLNALNIENKQQVKRYLKRFFAEHSTNEPITFMKDGKRTIVTVDELIEHADQDIGMVDRWLQAVKDSNSTFLRLLNEPVSKSKARAYTRTLEIKYRIQELHNNLSKAGIKDTKFMYEFKDGIPTGKFIRKYNDQYKDDWNIFRDKYGQKTVSYDELRAKFEAQAGKRVNGEFIPDAKYHSEEYKALNSAQREYYDEIMRMKKELETYLPPNYRDVLLAPQIRKGTTERLFQGGNFLENIKNYLKDGFVNQNNDDFIIERATLDNSSVRVIPVRYRQELNNMSDLTTDVSGAMIMYADMIHNFDEMNNIIDSMELLVDNFKTTGISQNRGGGKRVFTRLNSKITDVSKMTEQKIPGSESEMYKRIIDFYENNIYGQTQKDEGTIGRTNLSVRKTTNQLIKYTVLNTLAFNVLAGFANVITGNHNLRMEGIAGEFFKYKDLLFADKEYMRDIPNMVTDFESRNIKARVNLINDYFRVTQDAEDKFKHYDAYKSSKFSRIFSANNAFILMNSGEHYMANKMAIAMLHAYKMKDAAGNESNLYDALDTSEGRISIKKGYVKPDGTAFTEDDRIAFMRKLRELSERVNGIYNEEDKNAFQRTSAGALAFLYRRYLVPTLNRRFGKSNYNFALESETEGFYRTFAKFMWNGIQQVIKGQLSLKHDYDNLSAHEKANIIRATYEMVYVMAAYAVFSLLSGLGDDGDDPYYRRMLVYQVRRTITEVGAFSPIRPGGMAREALTLFQNPSASVSYVQGVANAFDMRKWNETIQSGQYKGWNKGFKSFVSIMPYYKTILRATTPEESLKWLDN